MPTANEPQTFYERGWIMRIRQANLTPPRRIFLLIHGWTGDERSMEVFARGLPPDSLLIFPRGPIKTPDGGYGWTAERAEILARMDDLVHPAQLLLEEVDRRIHEGTGLSEARLTVAGFSQGAAVAYTLALLFPQRIERLAALSGFMPSLSPDRQVPGLPGLKVYIAHGRKDHTIPVDRAHEAVVLFQSAGAEVEYCENDAGHKLPVHCLNELTRFLTA